MEILNKLNTAKQFNKKVYGKLGNEYIFLDNVKTTLSNEAAEAVYNWIVKQKLEEQIFEKITYNFSHLVEGDNYVEISDSQKEELYKMVEIDKIWKDDFNLAVIVTVPSNSDSFLAIILNWDGEKKNLNEDWREINRTLEKEHLETIKEWAKS